MSPSYVASFENVIYPIPEGEQVAKLTLGEKAVELSVGELRELLGLDDQFARLKMTFGNSSHQIEVNIPLKTWHRLDSYCNDKKVDLNKIINNSIDGFLGPRGY